MTRAQIENITVLYRWAALLTWVIDPQRPLRTIESEDPVRKRLYNETRRRWARPYADPFGNTPFIDEIKQRNPELAELAKNGAISSTTRNLSLPKLLEIGELLLKAGANPNEQEFFPGIPKVSNPGRTHSCGSPKVATLKPLIYWSATGVTRRNATLWDATASSLQAASATRLLLTT